MSEDCPDGFPLLTSTPCKEYRAEDGRETRTREHPLGRSLWDSFFALRVRDRPPPRPPCPRGPRYGPAVRGAIGKVENGAAPAVQAGGQLGPASEDYNFGEASGVDVDRQGNVWVFNRGHWPVMEFDRSGKMLQAWSQETFPVRSSHGLRVGPDGNIWCVDVPVTWFSSLAPRAVLLMVLATARAPQATMMRAMPSISRPTSPSAQRQLLRLRWIREFASDRVQPARRVCAAVGKKGNRRREFNLVHDVVLDSKAVST